MIDWLTFRAPLTLPQPLHGGYVASITLDHNTGERRTDWIAPKRVPVRGSHDAAIQVRSSPADPLGEIEISGNPAKFFQGHNVFGSDDLVVLCSALYRSVLVKLGITPATHELELVDRGQVRLLRVDVTYSFDFGNLSRVLSAIRSLESSAHLRHRGRGTLTKGSTLYFGKTSRRSSLKLYSKGQELHAHPLPQALLGTPLAGHADGLLRAEATLRAMELRDRGLAIAHKWTLETPSELHRAMMGKLSIADAFMLDADVLKSLPPRLQAAYQLWKDGHDLRAMFPPRTFYRYRAQLLPHGVDIAIKQPREESNVVRLPVVLTGRLVTDVPAWAVGTPLYFDPRRSA